MGYSLKTEGDIDNDEVLNRVRGADAKFDTKRPAGIYHVLHEEYQMLED